ncbi:hypothetical protein PRIC2_010872 [Phytophthora ramorum]
MSRATSDSAPIVTIPARHCVKAEFKRKEMMRPRNVLNTVSESVNAIDLLADTTNGWKWSTAATAVGDDSTRQVGYALTRYLLKTAPRPVLIRFCEPGVYFSINRHHGPHAS